MGAPAASHQVEDQGERGPGSTCPTRCCGWRPTSPARKAAELFDRETQAPLGIGRSPGRERARAPQGEGD
eukprot:6898347-Alexandrium_andersonii.AAC.1